MSLKHVHLLLISVATILLLMMGAWSYGQYQQLADSKYILSMIGCLGLSIVLIIYGISFFKKTKSL